LNPVFEWLSRVGTLGLVWVAVGLVLAVMWRRPRLFVLILAADGVADLVAAGLKRITHVQRPAFRYSEPRALVHVPHDGSFPSGHAATSFACATVLSVLAPRLAPGLYVLAAGIAYSRVYVGVHYPFDAIGGAALGVVVALVLLQLFRRG
jgi:undecaprenyl-diphosphatase